MGRRVEGSYTVGQLDVDLRRIVRRMLAAHEADAARSREAFGKEYASHLGPTVSQDRELATSRSLRALARHVDTMIDDQIVSARRRDNPAAWAAIGRELGITGQAASKRARTRNLRVVPLTPERYAEIVAEARHLTGRD